MYAVYILDDEWRLRGAFSTREAANTLAARLISLGIRAIVFRTAEKHRMAA
jgi:hypothetical protein